MDPLAVLMSLYAVNGIIGIAGHWTQIVKLFKARSEPIHFSAPTWTLWVYTTLVTLLYATLINGDALFILVASLYFAGTLTIWSLVVYKKWKYAGVRVE